MRGFALSESGETEDSAIILAAKTKTAADVVKDQFILHHQKSRGLLERSKLSRPDSKSARLHACLVMHGQLDPTGTGFDRC